MHLLANINKISNFAPACVAKLVMMSPVVFLIGCAGHSNGYVVSDPVQKEVLHRLSLMGKVTFSKTVALEEKKYLVELLPIHNGNEYLEGEGLDVLNSVVPAGEVPPLTYDGGYFAVRVSNVDGAPMRREDYTIARKLALYGCENFPEFQSALERYYPKGDTHGYGSNRVSFLEDGLWNLFEVCQ